MSSRVGTLGLSTSAWWKTARAWAAQNSAYKPAELVAHGWTLELARVELEQSLSPASLSSLLLSPVHCCGNRIFTNDNNQILNNNQSPTPKCGLGPPNALGVQSWQWKWVQQCEISDTFDKIKYSSLCEIKMTSVPEIDLTLSYLVNQIMIMMMTIVMTMVMIH